MMQVISTNSQSFDLYKNSIKKTKALIAKVQAIGKSLTTLICGETHRIQHHFSKSQHVQTFQHLFATASTPVPEKEDVFLSGAELLEAEVKKLSRPVALDQPAPACATVKELKKLSLLQSGAKKTRMPIDRVVISTLTGHTAQNKNEAFHSLLIYVNDLLKAKKTPNFLNDKITDVLKEAYRRENEFDALVQESRALELTERSALLQERANQLAQEVERLDDKAPLFYFGKVSQSTTTTIPPFLDSLLQKQLSNETYKLIQADPSALIEKIQSALRNVMADDATEAMKKVESSLRKVMDKTIGTINLWSPTFSDTVIASLKEDLRELAIGPHSAETTQHLAGEVWDRLLEQGFEKMIEETVRKTLSESKDLIQGQIEAITEQVSSQMPETALECLSAVGLSVGGRKDFWIEVNKQANGKCRLCLFSTDLKNKHNPLVFKDLEANQLNSDFFVRLLSYQAWPEWNMGVSYSLEDLQEVLTKFFGKKEADSSDSPASPNSIRATSCKMLDKLQIYLHHHLELNEADFSRLFHYELPLDALVHFWPQISENPALLKDVSLRSELHAMINQISQESVELYRTQKLSLDELKVVHATVWDVREALLAATTQHKTSDTFPSMVIPPQLHGFMKDLLQQTGITPMHIEMLKEACVSVMGEEFANTFDLLIEEIVPEIAIRQGITKPIEMSWSDIFSIQAVNKRIADVGSMRFSLLHIYRVVAQITSLIMQICHLSIAATPLSSLLVYCVPQLNGYLLGTHCMAMLTSYFGPDILKKVLPEKAFMVFKATIGLYQEIFSYIKGRIATCVLSSLLRHMLGKEEIDSLNIAAKKLQQQLTREGELSFELRNVKETSKHFKALLFKSEEQQQAVLTPELEEIPYPQKCELNSANLIPTLQLWLQSLTKSNFSDIQKEFYLHAQLRNLPIPGQKGGEIWLEHEQPQELLENLHLLLCKCIEYERNRKTYFSTAQSLEIVTSLYSLYAIIDTLARRDASAHLSDALQANGRALAHYMGNPIAEIANPSAYQKLKELGAYFGFDPLKRYNEQELDAYESNRLFNFQSRGSYLPKLIDYNRISHLGLKFSKDGIYYQSLLQDEAVLQRLALHGVTEKSSFFEKMELLFLDPPLKTDSLDIAKSADVGDRSLDRRLGVLPRSFYLLRLAHLMAQQKSYAIGKSGFEIKELEKYGLILSLYKRHTNDLSFLENTFDAMTGDLFKTIPVGCHADGVLSPEAKFASQLEMRIKGWNHTLWLILYPSKRSQSEIVANPIFLGEKPLLLQEEKCLFEMINSDASDKIIRCLGLFTQARHRLSDPHFRSLFDLFLQDRVALEAQLKERPEITEDLGRYFSQTLDYFKYKQDWETCLYLAKEGQELLSFCQLHNAQAPFQFPDFCSFIRNEITSVYRARKPEDRKMGESGDWLMHAYTSIVALYFHLDPETVSPSEKRRILLDVAKGTYLCRDFCEEDLEISYRNERVNYLWGHHLRAAMVNDQEFRKEVLDGLLIDLGFDFSRETGNWEGTFPIYHKGIFSLNLNSIDKITVPSSVKKNHFVSNVKKEGKLEEYQEFEGKRFRLLDRCKIIDQNVISLSDSEQFWIEENSAEPIILLTSADKVIERLFTKKEDGASQGDYTIIERQHYVNEMPMNQADLSSCEHGLSLLSWFQPPSETRVFTTKETAEATVQRIEFPKVKLAFDIKEIKGEKRAVETQGPAPGFYLAKRQRHPDLLPYSRYLLVENERGEKKVHLPTQSLQQLLGSYVVKNIGKMSLSPLLENSLFALIGGEERLLTYSLNERGELDSEDPEGLTYLALFHLAQGETEKSFRYLKRVEELGQLQPLSSETMTMLDQFLLPLLMTEGVQAEQMLLRIAILLEKNSLVQQQDVPSDSGFMRAIAIQVKYSNYLEAIKKGAPPYLSHHDELFLLKGVGRCNRNMFAAQFKNFLADKQTQTWLSKIGIDTLADHLMMVPAIAERYHNLRMQQGGESAWQQRAEALLLHTLFGSSSAPQVNIIPGSLLPSSAQVSSSTIFAKMLSVWKTATTLSRPYVSSLEFPDKFFLESENLETLSTNLSELTPHYICHHFFSFYRLAVKQIPKTWVGDVEKEALFARLETEFHRNLPLLHGNVKDQFESYLMNCLATIADHPTCPNYPNPDVFENLLTDITKLEGLIEEKREIYQEIMKVVKETGGGCPILEARYGELKLQVEATQKKEPNFQLKILLKKLLEQTQQQTLTSSILSGLQQNATSGLLGMAQQTLLSMTGVTALSNVQTCVNAGLNLWHTVQHVQEAEASAQAEKAQKEAGALVDNSSPLDPSLLKDMTDREAAIDRVMQGLLTTYFDVEIVPATDTEVAFIEEETVQKEFETLNKSLQEFYDRPKELGKKYRFKADKKVEELECDLAQLKSHVAKRLEMERQNIEEYANYHFVREGGEGEFLIEELGAKKQPLIFKEIDDCFLQDQDALLSKRSFMKEKELGHLKERLYLYHVMASRWNLLLERVPGLQKPSEALLTTVARELDRRRVYTFDSAPERLIRGKLVFESRSGKMLWTKQSSQIDRLLLTPQARLVVELIMGSGKTWYGIPNSAYFGADGESLVINIWPTAVAKTNISTIATQAKEMFAQAVYALDISRTKKWIKDSLWGFYHLFEQVKLERQQINMTKESLQALELCFIEETLKVNLKYAEDRKEDLNSFRNTLKLIRQKGKGHVDEAHIAFNPRKELNHPIGKAKRVEMKFVKIIEETLFQLIATPAFNSILSVKSKTPAPLLPEEFKAKILPLLAQKMVQVKRLNISKLDQAEVIKYISGEAEEIPQCVATSRYKSEIALVKGLLTTLLPKALEKTIHVDFAASKQGNGDYARPSEGNNNPLEQATIRNPFEALVKSALLLAHDRLTSKQLDTFIEDLQQKACNNARLFNCNLNETTEAKFFATHCPGYDLFGIKEEERPNVHLLLNQSDRAVLRYLSTFISKEILYFAQNLSSNPSNFGSMFATILADTGTPYNDGCYPTETQVLSDPGTQGESIDIMEQPGKSSIEILEKEAPNEVLNELIERFFDKDPNVRAFIDRGAALNGISSDKVAEQLLRYIEENRPDLDGVAFYLDRELVILERGAKKPIPIHLSHVPVEKRLSYFPQPQTYAADIPQTEQAIGVISVGEDLAFNELSQAIWRMRNLRKTDQKIVFVMTKRVRDKISDGKTPTVRDIIAFAERNEKRMLAEDNYQADRQKLHNVVRRAVLDKALFAPTIEEAFTVMKAFKDVLVTQVEDDPFKLFGLIDTMVEPEKIFEQLTKKYKNRIETSGLFTQQEQEEIEAELQKIGKGHYPKLVHSYSAGGHLNAELLDDLNKESQIEVNTTIAVEEQQEQDVNINQNQNQNITVTQDEKPKQTFFPWPSNLNPTQLDTWLKITTGAFFEKTSSVMQPLKNFLSCFSSHSGGVPLFSLKEVLFQSGQKEVANKISPSILTSNNIMHMVTSCGASLEPFGPYQVPIFEVLVIQRGSEAQPQLLLIDQKEASYWRKKLEEDRAGKHPRDPNVKIGIYDLSTRALVAEGHHRFTDELQKQMFKRTVVQLKFLRGDVNFEDDEYKILKSWLKSNLESLMLHWETVRKHHALGVFEESKLEKIIFQIREEQEALALKV